MQKPKQEFLFVNNVRFLSMAAIVAGHSVGVTPHVTGGDLSGLLVRATIQAFKFGTIGFFLISGFLMGNGLERKRASVYLARRLHTVFLPWLLWFLLYCSLELMYHLAVGDLHFDSMPGMLISIIDLVEGTLLGSAYWFIPNLILSMCVLLLCKHFLDDLRFGAALLIPSLLYGVNVHTQWLPLSYTQVLSGFVFYLWLGAWAARNYARVETWISRVRASHFLCLVVLSGWAALQESSILTAAGSKGAVDTLRITNQLYSVAVVLAIVKSRKPAWPHFMNVRTGTFGIYLSHTIALSAIWHGGKQILPVSLSSAARDSNAISLCISFVLFASAYTASTLLTTYLVSKPRVRWVVGNFEGNSGTTASDRKSRKGFRLETVG
jgi:membrane-bound acyltransferase YfiQ involved in biofilm formation